MGRKKSKNKNQTGIQKQEPKRRAGNELDSGSKKRDLTQEELELWRAVTKDVQRSLSQDPLQMEIMGSDDDQNLSSEQLRRSALLSSVAHHQNTNGNAFSVQKEKLQKAPSENTEYKPKTLAPELRVPSKKVKNIGSQSVLEAGDPAMDKRVRRRRQTIDDVLDLHGLTQIQARTRFERFIETAQNRGHRCVLVITGKGGDPIERQKNEFARMIDGNTKRGVLRTRFLEWVEEPAMRMRISRVSQAKQNDGGSGAFYVFIKK